MDDVDITSICTQLYFRIVVTFQDFTSTIVRRVNDVNQQSYNLIKNNILSIF